MTFNYKQYFETIKPKTKMDIYNRFLFAFCSVHVNWQSNIRGYLLLKDKYHTNEIELRNIIEKSGLGLINTRTKAIYDFTQKYLKDSKYFKKQVTETWTGYEKRLMNNIFGLGPAKSAFLIELIYPNEARVVCTDVWILRWAKQPSSVSKKIHEKVKQGFLNHCNKHNTPPIEMRWKLWDKYQKKQTPRYWSWVLEKNAFELDKTYKENYAFK